MNPDLIQTLGTKEGEQVASQLTSILPHIEDEFCIVGGVAIRYLLARARMPIPSRPLGDLDIIVPGLDSISPDACNDLLLAHYHGAHPPTNNTSYACFVEPHTRSKIDIFDYNIPPHDPLFVPFGGILVRVRNAEDQLVKTVKDLLKIKTERAPVDPKQFDDAKLLLLIPNLDSKRVEKYWTDSNLVGLPKTFAEGYNLAQELKREHSEFIIENPYRQLKSYVCEFCNPPENMPLTPTEEIYRILGYSE